MSKDPKNYITISSSIEGIGDVYQTESYVYRSLLTCYWMCLSLLRNNVPDFEKNFVLSKNICKDIFNKCILSKDYRLKNYSSKFHLRLDLDKINPCFTEISKTNPFENDLYSILPIDPLIVEAEGEDGIKFIFEYHLSDVSVEGFLKIGSKVKSYLLWDRNLPKENWQISKRPITVTKIYSGYERCATYPHPKVNILPLSGNNWLRFTKPDEYLYTNVSYVDYGTSVSGDAYYISIPNVAYNIEKYYRYLNEQHVLYQNPFDGIKSLLETYFKTKSESNNIIKDSSTNKKQKRSIMKGIFSNLMDKYKSMLVPVTDSRLKITMDGNVAVRNNEGEYVCIKADNQIVSYPADFTIDVPIYIIKKPFSAVAVGEIIRKDSTYVKVIGKNDDGGLKCLSFTGYTTTKKAVIDYMLGTSYADVVVNIMNIQSTGMNPMMFALMNGETNMKDLMMLQMMSGNAGGMNPMMLMLLMKDGDGDSNKMLETMMMMQMMNGGNGGMNPFASMFGNNAQQAVNPFDFFKNMNPGTPANPGNAKKDVDPENGTL